MISQRQIPYEFPIVSFAVVGEAPGADEDEAGRPFVGRAGQLLNKCLEQAGIDRSSILVGNCFRYRPPHNDVSAFFTDAAEEGSVEYPPYKGRYLDKEWEAELKVLFVTLRLLRVRVVVPLGATALWAFTGDSSITACRGRATECARLPHVVVFPSFHPSFVLRGGATAEVLVGDLKDAYRYTIQE